ncbi:hypothetical protein RUND412_008515 [Rhizina undulata]
MPPSPTPSPPPQVLHRLTAITTHMTTPPSTRPPVTCHVLNTTTGKPAASIPCTLSRFLKLADGSPSSSSFELAKGETNADGRVTEWAVRQKGIAGKLVLEEGTAYKIRFETWDYFGGETFFPYVEVVFVVKEVGEHYHVPLLLSPYAYSTYRGS